jgi:hypothetical protein
MRRRGRGGQLSPNNTTQNQYNTTIQLVLACAAATSSGERFFNLFFKVFPNSYS